MHTEEPILLVEGNLGDEERMLRAYDRTDHRNRMLVARTAENALTLLRACADGIRFKLVLVDLHVPHFGAPDFLRRLRRDPKVKNTPVVVLTPEDTTDEDGKQLSVGADAWVRKTREPKNLQTLLDRIVQRFIPSRQREETSSPNTARN